MTPDELQEAADRVRTRVGRDVVLRAFTLYDAGWQPMRVAEEVGISASALHGWRYQAGIPANGSQSQDKIKSSKVLQKTAALYESGMTIRQVGEALGLSDMGVTHRLENAGVPRRPTGYAPGSQPRRLPDGYVSAVEAGKMAGLAHCTVHRRCMQGKVVGAQMFDVTGTGPSRIWGIPEASARALKPLVTRRAARPRTHRTTKPKLRKRSGESYLPIAPFAEWLNAHPLGFDAMAVKAGMVDGGRLRLWAKLEGGNTIGMSTADVVLTANDAHLDDVWPDLDAILAAGARQGSGSLRSIETVAA